MTAVTFSLTTSYCVLKPFTMGEKKEIYIDLTSDGDEDCLEITHVSETDLEKQGISPGEEEVVEEDTEVSEESDSSFSG